MCSVITAFRFYPPYLLVGFSVIAVESVKCNHHLCQNHMYKFDVGCFRKYHYLALLYKTSIFILYFLKVDLVSLLLMYFRIPKKILRLVKLVVDSDLVALMALSLNDVYPPLNDLLLRRFRCEDGCTSRGVRDLCCGKNGGLCCPNIACITIKVSEVWLFCG